MRFQKTTPAKIDFFKFFVFSNNKKASLLDIVHLIEAMLQFFGAYLMLRGFTYKLGDFLSITFSVVSATLIAFFIQSMLRAFLPAITKGLLCKIWNTGKHEKLAFIFDIVPVALVWSLSLYIGFEGAAGGVQKMSAKYEPVKYDSVIINNSIADIKKANEIFNLDSLEAVKNTIDKNANTNSLIELKEKQMRNEVNLLRSKDRITDATNTENKYLDEISQLKTSLIVADFSALRATRDAKILDSNKAILRHKSDIDKTNKEQKISIESTTNNKASGLGLISIVLSVFMIFGYLSKSNFELGSEIETIPQPDQSYFDASISQRWFFALNDRIKNWLSVKLSGFERKTLKYYEQTTPEKITYHSKDNLFPVMEQNTGGTNNENRDTGESVRPCPICKKSFSGRSDKAVCSDICRAIKSYRKTGFVPKFGAKLGVDIVGLSNSYK